LAYAPEQPGVPIRVHQQLTVQIPHAAQNLGEFAFGESKCFLKEDSVKLFHALHGPHFPGALAWHVQQHLEEHTCTEACNNTFTEALPLHHEDDFLEVACAASTSHHEGGHQLARRALQHQQYL
jgi:hypothetical protein